MPTVHELYTLKLTDSEIVFLIELLPGADTRRDFGVAQLRALLAKLRKLKDPR